MLSRQRAVTLLNVLLTLVLVSIMASMAMVDWRGRLTKARLDRDQHSLMAIIRWTRTQAIITRQPMRLTPKVKGEWAGGQQAWRWQSQAWQFVKEWPAWEEQAHLRYRGFGDDHALRFNEHGFLLQNGRFSLCIVDKCRQLVISRSGRIRIQVLGD